MTTPHGTHWKTDIADLRSRAMAVLDHPAVAEKMSARAAAAVLSGIVGHIARKWTLDLAQRACADLARHDPAWETSFGRLPTVHGYVTEPVQLVATVARSLLPLSGNDNLRAALAFWASEDDPSVWTKIAA